MAHPRMYDPDDPLLARVRGLALAFPGAGEKESHGRPAFFTKKVFVYYGGANKVDGAWTQHPQAIVFLPSPDDRVALESDGRFWVPAYLGVSGWLGLDLDATTDYDEVSELVEGSYRTSASAALIATLDAR